MTPQPPKEGSRERIGAKVPPWGLPAGRQGFRGKKGRDPGLVHEKSAVELKIFTKFIK